MRTIKEPEVRKNEILDAAEQLFVAKGFENATVHDILAKTGIAKGTFYYYFKSKEDALDAIVKRQIDRGVEKAQAIVANQDMGVHEKLLAVIMAQKPQSSGLPADVLHEPQNAQLHQKMVSEYVLRLSPLLGNIVEEGIRQGIFNTPFPRESIEMVFSAALVLFDDGFFHWQPEELAAKIPAFLCALERVLGAETGSFAGFAAAFGNGG